MGTDTGDWLSLHVLILLVRIAVSKKIRPRDFHEVDFWMYDDGPCSMPVQDTRMGNQHRCTFHQRVLVQKVLLSI